MSEYNNRDRKRNPNRRTEGGDTKAAEVVSGNKKGPGESIQAKPLEVIIYGNNFEKGLRAFRALVQKDRILSTYKEKQSYEKKSDKVRRKKGESARRRMELESSDKEFGEKKKPKKTFKHKRHEENTTTE
jgi:ribosomal protein S21